MWVDVLCKHQRLIYVQKLEKSNYNIIILRKCWACRWLSFKIELCQSRSVLTAECDRSLRIPQSDPNQFYQSTILRFCFLFVFFLFFFFRLVNSRVFMIDRSFHVKAPKSTFEVEKRDESMSELNVSWRISITCNNFYLIFHTRVVRIYIFIILTHTQFVSHIKRAVSFATSSVGLSFKTRILTTRRVSRLRSLCKLRAIVCHISVS